MSKGNHVAAQECRDNLVHGVSNLLSIYAKATNQEIEDGKAWYSSAYDEATRIAYAYNVPLVTVVKVACALSPRLSWWRNMPAAEDVVRHYVSGGYVPNIEPYITGEMNLQRTHHDMTTTVVSDDPQIPQIYGPTKVNIVKALWVLQGHDWILRGQKVNSFCDNILHHNTSNLVTVDSHAIQCWFGRMESGTYHVTKPFYTIIEADYQRVAALVGLTPLQFQAVVWLVKKRIVPHRTAPKAHVCKVEWKVAQDA